MHEEGSSSMSRNDGISVVIIESPSATDLLDARTEGKMLQEGLRLANIYCSYSLTVNARTFWQALEQRVKHEIQVRSACPILHISAHGDKDGIALTDKAYIKWAELAEYLRPLNQALHAAKVGLFVGMSSCSGWAGCKMAMNSKEPPFDGLVGPRGGTTWAEAAIAFITFYHHVINCGSIGGDAVTAMNTACGKPHFKMELGQNVQKEWYLYWLEQQAAQQRLATGQGPIPRAK